jgi:hypothetical protein
MIVKILAFLFIAHFTSAQFLLNEIFNKANCENSSPYQGQAVS